MRTEAGEVLGAISDEELLVLVNIFRKSAILAQAHEYRRFNGDILLLIALEGKKIKGEDGSGVSFTGLWEAYVSGQITEIRLPCGHEEILQPEMLGIAWPGISAWLRLDG